MRRTLNRAACAAASDARAPAKKNISFPGNYPGMDTLIQKSIKYRNVISLLLRNPDKKFTPLELSRASHVPYATMWRLVQWMQKKKIVVVERIGAYNICTLNKKFPRISALENLFSSVSALEGIRKKRILQ